ncbi:MULTISPECIES: LacI family DNA-binding transcriptional regulator [Hymenobacter]|uniref:Transcriptional regulator, LacI family n=1 Tax=Hymenobacter mucosus TaxID=1411120 RepID=A0A238XGQ2_9BACT|nr:MULTISPECIES: LacI family DNA-binding transcriptional regulator [Hymenobacter]SNR58165.1 transcriptional regulator, LacI family [Hymenobacter mucosus]
MKPISLKQLAQALNLSSATVSRALNDSHEVSAETKGRVLALARELNYEPHPFASSLRRQKSKTIGVILPEVANNFFSLAIDGIEEIARLNNYHVLVYLTHDDHSREVDIVQHLAGGRADGILLSVASETNQFTHLDLLAERGIPTVFFDRVRAGSAAATVTTDDHRGGYKATQHLLQAGCRHIAYLLVSNNLSIGQKRMQGYQHAMQEAGLEYSPHLVVQGQRDKAENVALIRQLLEEHPEVDGIFASVESLALSAYEACHEVGRRIPEDVKVVGFSNMAAAALLEPGLTTITQPAYEMGREAAKILFKAITKNKPVLPAQSLELESELVVRRSTEAARLKP